LFRDGYLADPHTALAWAALDAELQEDELGCFLCTAHPAKFLEVVKDVLELDLDLPVELAEVEHKEILSKTIKGSFPELREILQDS
jgi:threonine synthase